MVTQVAEHSEKQRDVLPRLNRPTHKQRRTYETARKQNHVYRPNDTAELAADHELQDNVWRVSIRAAGVSESTVKSALRGERKRKATLVKLRSAMNTILG